MKPWVKESVKWALSALGRGYRMEGGDSGDNSDNNKRTNDKSRTIGALHVLRFSGDTSWNVARPILGRVLPRPLDARALSWRFKR